MDNPKPMQDRQNHLTDEAHELVDSWINGNRSAVFEALTNHDCNDGIALTTAIMAIFAESADTTDLTDFARAAMDRIAY